MKDNLNDKKKMIIGVVIAVITLLIVTIGATYAYFSVTGSNDNNTTKLDMNAEQAGTVSLSGGANMHIKLTAESMSQTNINSKYYATIDSEKDYATTQESIDVAKLLVVGGSTTATYQCTFDLNTSVTGTMADVISSGDAQIVYSGLINATDDLSSYNPTRKITANLVGDKAAKSVQAYVVFNNTETDQIALAGKTLNINVTVANFSCDTGNAEVEGASSIFYIGENETQEYTNTNVVSMTLNLEDEDATEYCITEENTSDNCEWQSISSDIAYENNLTKLSNNLLANTNTITFTHTLSSGDGEKTVYVYLKSSTGNIKLYARDTIIIDSVAPTVSASVNENVLTITITSNESGTYCVNTSASDTSNCTFTGNIKANDELTTSSFSESGTYYIHIIDEAGNVGHSTSVSISLSGTIGEYLLSNPTTGLDTTAAYNGLYRYIGTTVDNYVSLSGVLYRIIGVTSEANSTLGLQANQLKLIKAESIGKYNWHTDDTTDTKWESSAMYTYLQGNEVLGNTSIIPSGWSSKINSVKWNIGDVQSYTNASTIIGLEDDTVTSSSSKIGLMYLSEYYYANTAGGTTNCYSACSNWMTASDYEWTMIRYGYNSDNDDYRAITMYSRGDFASNRLVYSYLVRPVFYLDPSVTYVSGSGQESDPIILN